MVIIISRFYATCAYYCKASDSKTDETKEYYNKCYYEEIPLYKTVDIEFIIKKSNILNPPFISLKHSNSINYLCR